MRDPLHGHVPDVRLGLEVLPAHGARAHLGRADEAHDVAALGAGVDVAGGGHVEADHALQVGAEGLHHETVPFLVEAS